MDSPTFDADLMHHLPTPPSEEQLGGVSASEDKQWLSSIPSTPIDDIFTLAAAFQRDTHDEKVNLGMGVYRTATGNSWPLPSVSGAEILLSESNDSRRHDYLAPEGDPEYLTLTRDLLFGDDLTSKQNIISVQTLSGSGANHIAAVFLSRFARPSRVWLSDPSWQNHRHIWAVTGTEIAYYPYFDSCKKALAFDGALETFETDLQPGDVVVLQACAHNPTGQDPTHQQWRTLAAVLARKQAIVLFDCAYQGFASGDPYADAWAVRYFSEAFPGMPLVAAQSFSKNFGLYGQRAGALHFSFGAVGEEARRNIQDSVTVITRAEYSFSPRAGSTLVKTVLGNAMLKNQWFEDLQTMSSRIREMRVALHAALIKLQTPGSWDHIVEQIGMFSYTGLTAEDAQALREEHHIYLLETGRISLSGLNSGNVERVAEAIDKIVRRRVQKHRSLGRGAFGWNDASEVDVVC